MSLIDENLIEEISIEWFEDLGYQYVYGPNIAPDGNSPERDDFRKVILEDRLRCALKKIIHKCQVEQLTLQFYNYQTLMSLGYE